ncbi:Uncharacterised protein [Porphyromonas macacae]|uniref:Uncharacterized protein n=1 Tax=Porphyromonas macacae TaxID=28115 RepID=A0A379DH68_9PORP|nr:Uncharacterised protein [Porphyromonas macacae]
MVQTLLLVLLIFKEKKNYNETKNIRYRLPRKKIHAGFCR